MLKKEYPNENISTLSAEKLKRQQERIKQWYKDEEEFPILKFPEEAVNFFQLLDEINQEVSEFKEKLEYIPIKFIVYKWLMTSRCYKKDYASYITKFFKRKIMHEFFADGDKFTVGGFRHIRHQAAIERIRKIEDLSENTKEKMVGCYISFLGYLNTISYGWFKRENFMVKTNYKMAPNIANKTLSFSDWRTFIDVLFSINVRDELIARCIIQGTRRVSDVLDLKVNQVDFLKNIIYFKRGNKRDEIVYNAQFIKELRVYIEDTADQRKDSSMVFVTRTGKRVVRSRLNYSFAKASLKFGINKVTPEVLRASWITLKQQGYDDVAIIQRRSIKRKYIINLSRDSQCIKKINSGD